MLPMRFAQAWRRRGISATAVTFVLPAALAVAAFLLGGGLRGLGAAGQLFTGPQVPRAAVTVASVSTPRSRGGLPTVPAAPASGFFAAAGGPGPAARAPGRGPGSPVATVPH